MHGLLYASSAEDPSVTWTTGWWSTQIPQEPNYVGQTATESYFFNPNIKMKAEDAEDDLGRGTRSWVMKWWTQDNSTHPNNKKRKHVPQLQPQQPQQDPLVAQQWTRQSSLPRNIPLPPRFPQLHPPAEHTELLPSYLPNSIINNRSPGTHSCFIILFLFILNLLPLTYYFFNSQRHSRHGRLYGEQQ